MENKDITISSQLLKELGCYAAIYGVVILIAKGFELLKDRKKK